MGRSEKENLLVKLDNTNWARLAMEAAGLGDEYLSRSWVDTCAAIADLRRKAERPEQWEFTSKVADALGFKPGDAVSDDRLLDAIEGLKTARLEYADLRRLKDNAETMHDEFVARLCDTLGLTPTGVDPRPTVLELVARLVNSTTATLESTDACPICASTNGDLQVCREEYQSTRAYLQGELAERDLTIDGLRVLLDEADKRLAEAGLRIAELERDQMVGDGMRRG